ncbi:hypothetical protein TNCV_1497951 [Trichonephila clavipes]|nr:hypothetical protein TNCV_1497951 [Trichonephila clavipes]
MPTQQERPSNLGEKTGDIPTQQDKPSNLGKKGGIAQIGRISTWCSRKCHSPRAPHHAGGQVTKLAPDAEIRYSRGTDPGRWLFKLSRSLMYLLTRLSLAVVRRFEWSTVRQMISGSLPSSRMLAVDSSIGQVDYHG